MASGSLQSKSVAFESLSVLSIFLMILHKVRGHSCWFLNYAFPDSMMVRFAKRLGFKPLDLESMDSLLLSEHSYSEVNYAVDRLVGGAHARGLFKDLFQVPGAWTTPPIQVAIGNRLSKAKPDLFALHIWANSVGGDARVIVRSKRSFYILCGMQPSVQAKCSPLLMAELLILRLRGLLLRELLSRSRRPIALNPDHEAIVKESNNDASVTSVAIFNHGPEYTGLYRYGSLFDEDWLMDAFCGPVRYWSSPDAPSYGWQESRPWPLATLTPSDSIRIAWKWLSHLMRARTLSDALLLWLACEAEQRLINTAHSIAAQYPKLKAAVVAYDLQLPPILLFALARCGVRSFSFQERPAIAVDQGAFVAADVVLSASPWFSRKLNESWAYTLRDAVDVGMWRTDLVARKRASSSTSSTKLILVLPYTPITNGSQAAFPISSSVTSVKHFIHETVDLARQVGDYQFVLRAKSIDWLDTEEFLDVRTVLDSLDNYTVSREYATLNVSYELLAEASLVLCKPTSLGEEALSLGVPTIFHDYTHNSTGYHHSTWTHIPAELWVQSSQELYEATVRMIACSSNQELSWIGEGRSIFGDLSDGCVQDRSRAFVQAFEI
mgnify:CR=1 FL=1